MSRQPSAGERDALRRMLAAAKLEILPLRAVLDEVTRLEPGTTLAVTASPSKGLDASIAFAAGLRAAGRDVVVHLAARMVRDRVHLAELLGKMRDAGLSRAFVVGGDAPQAGDYPDALSLLRELAELDARPTEIGIGCYPQGHGVIPDQVLAAALLEKAPYADYMTSQLCFDANALAAWLAARRAQGLDLPLDVGIPGAVDTARLVRISARIGVRDAARFAAKQGGLLARLLRPGGYRPDGLLRELAPTLADPAAGVRGLHVFTFNQVDRTQRWRRGFLAELSS